MARRMHVNAGVADGERSIASSPRFFERAKLTMSLRQSSGKPRPPPCRRAKAKKAKSPVSRLACTNCNQLRGGAAEAPQFQQLLPTLE